MSMVPADNAFFKISSVNVVFSFTNRFLFFSVTIRLCFTFLSNFDFVLFFSLEISIVFYFSIKYRVIFAFLSISTICYFSVNYRAYFVSFCEISTVICYFSLNFNFLVFSVKIWAVFHLSVIFRFCFIFFGRNIDYIF